MTRTTDDVLRSRVVETLRQITDPETRMSVCDLEVIREIRVERGAVRIVYTPPANLCPVGIDLAFHIRREIQRVDGVTRVSLRVRKGFAGAIGLPEEP